MVLIWTQFGVKHKNVNVKCKVRVMHRGDSSGSSSSAVSTFFFLSTSSLIKSPLSNYSDLNVLLEYFEFY